VRQAAKANVVYFLVAVLLMFAILKSFV